MKKIRNLIKETISNIENINSKRNLLAGIPSGLVELDRITSGWQKSELVIIAARPAMGKTAFALSIARNAAIDFGKTVAIFSVDVTSIELTTRLISIESQISSFKLKRGSTENINWEQINSKIKKLADSKLFIDDTLGLTISEIILASYDLKMQQMVDLIIIENLQDIVDSKLNRTRTQDVSSIIKSLNALARDLEIPVIVFSQVSRTSETRKNYHPTLIDLPQYNAIKNYASTIMFLHRPEYFNCDLEEHFDENGVSTKGMAEVIIGKLNNECCVDNIVKLRYVEGYFSNYLQTETELNNTTAQNTSNYTQLKELPSIK